MKIFYLQIVDENFFLQIVDEIFYLQFEIVEVRFSHLGGTRNSTSGARIEKFQKTSPQNL